MFLHHSACRGRQHVARRSGLSIADKLLDFVSLCGQQRAADANAKSRPRNQSGNASGIANKSSTSPLPPSVKNLILPDPHRNRNGEDS
jgi:hypothetical protein